MTSPLADRFGIAKPVIAMLHFPGFARAAAPRSSPRSDLRVPFGVNILWDAKASLALARATGAAVDPARVGKLMEAARAAR